MAGGGAALLLSSLVFGRLLNPAVDPELVETRAADATGLDGRLAATSAVAA